MYYLIKTETMSNNLRETHEQKITASSYLQLFKGRTDVIGLATTKSTLISSEEELLQHVTNHLNGECRLGFYNLLPDGTSTWAMVEFESHHNQSGLTNPTQSSLDFISHLQSVGINSYRELSKNSNKNCYHVWIFFTNPISARKVHGAFNALVEQVMNIKTEVFPKGFNTTGIGNFVWLPLFGGRDNWGNGVPDNQTVFIDEQGNPYPDQSEFLTLIKCIKEDDIDRLINDFNLTGVEKQNKTDSSELVDGLEKVRQCSFMKHCENNAEVLPEPLWYAWITNAVRCVGGREYIHEYSAKHPQYNKLLADKKIHHALQDTGPMTHEAIVNVGYTCECPTKFKAPISRAYYRDVQVEIERIKAISEHETKLIELQALITYINRLDKLERDYWTNQVKKEFKLTNASFEQSTDTTIDYEKDLKEILTACKIGKIDYEEQGTIIYTWYRKQGVRFFKDRNNQHYLFAEKSLMTIAKYDSVFESFLFDSTGTTTATKNGEVYVKVLQALTQREGTLIEANTWIHTNQVTHTIYFNLNNDEHELIRITPNGLSIIENGSNEEQILLSCSSKICPLKYLPMTDETYRDGLTTLKELVIDNLACKESDRILCYSWKIAGMFFDFVRTSPHLRLEGDSAGGKSTGMELLSYPLYGEDQKKIGTIASNYTDGAVNPLVLLDNLEVKDLSQGLQDFLVTAVTGITKEKRKTGTDSDTVKEKTKCLVCSTGIENFSLHEMINRTYIIEFDKEVYGTNFSDSIFTDIKKYRNEIMSAEFQLVSKVLKRIEDKTWQAYETKINTEHKGHSKSRANSFLSLMVLIAEELLNAWGSTKPIWELVDEWINTQNQLSEITSEDSNPLPQYLRLLHKEALKSNKPHSKPWEFDIELCSVSDSSLFVRGYAKDLHTTFSKLCQLRSIQYQYKSAMQLSKRMRDSSKVLVTAGWNVEVNSRQKHGVDYSITYGDSEFTNTSLTPSLTPVNLAKSE